MSLKNFFKIKSLDGDDEFDDDLLDDDDDDDDDDDYDDDDDDDYYVNRRKTKNQRAKTSSFSSSSNQTSRNTYSNSYNSNYQRKAENVVDFNKSTRSSQRVVNGSELYVIKPHDFSESQTVAQHLKAGKAIVINMEGIEVEAAQRIIDFIGGACFALEGSLQAISGSIFIAAPNDVFVSGDLRSEIINETTISPNLTNRF